MPRKKEPNTALETLRYLKNLKVKDDKYVSLPYNETERRFKALLRIKDRKISRLEAEIERLNKKLENYELSELNL